MESVLLNEKEEVTYPDIAVYFFKSKAGGHMFELYGIIQCLTNDGYAEKPYDIYRLTFRGKIFIENGGYVKQSIEKRRKDQYDRIQALMLTIGSILAGVGSILLFAVEAYKIIHNPK